MTSNRNSRDPRVFITGMGVLSPAGNDPDEFWRGITNGRSAIRALRAFAPPPGTILSSGEVDDEVLLARSSPRDVKRSDRAALMGLISARQALENAGILEAASNGLRVGSVIGSAMGPCHRTSASYAAFFTKGWRGIRPMTVPTCMFNTMGSSISMALNLTGAHQAVAAACASGTMALIHAFESIRNGSESVVLAGGCDAPLEEGMVAAWNAMRVLSANPDPEAASRPFDRDRDGLVMAEGAGMFVLEEAEHALARGATIHGEVIGIGTSSDAGHITAPKAEGQAEALRMAIESSGLTPGDIDYINAHGTSTTLNDLAETRAIKLAFGETAGRIAISSTKSVLGHTMGASGALGLMATLLAMKHGTLPPTVNLEQADPECDLDYVPQVPRPGNINTALVNSFAFGGANAVVAVRAPGGN